MGYCTRHAISRLSVVRTLLVLFTRTTTNSPYTKRPAGARSRMDRPLCRRRSQSCHGRVFESVDYLLARHGKYFVFWRRSQRTKVLSLTSHLISPLGPREARL